MTLLRSSVRVQRQTNRRREPAPVYQPGQGVWLSSKDLVLQTEFRKLASQIEVVLDSASLMIYKVVQLYIFL